MSSPLLTKYSKFHMRFVRFGTKKSILCAFLREIRTLIKASFILHSELRFRYVLGLGKAKTNAKTKKNVVGSEVVFGERPVQ